MVNYRQSACGIQIHYNEQNIIAVSKNDAGGKWETTNCIGVAIKKAYNNIIGWALCTWCTPSSYASGIHKVYTPFTINYSWLQHSYFCWTSSLRLGYSQTTNSVQQPISTLHQPWISSASPLWPPCSPNLRAWSSPGVPPKVWQSLLPLDNLGQKRTEWN